MGSRCQESGPATRTVLLPRDSSILGRSSRVMVTAPHVVILGSGVAGLVAGHELAERGLAVTVIEAASIPGGRTSSWRDARGRDLDTGLHVVADHYVNLIEVLGSLGATRHLRWFTKHL